MTFQQRLLSNGIDLFKEAEILQSNGRYRRAFCLYITAFEQFNKVLKLQEGKSAKMDHRKNLSDFNKGLKQTTKNSFEPVIEKFVTQENLPPQQKNYFKNKFIDDMVNMTDFVSIRNACFYEDEIKTINHDYMVVLIKDESALNALKVIIENLKKGIISNNLDLRDTGFLD